MPPSLDLPTPSAPRAPIAASFARLLRRDAAAGITLALALAACGDSGDDPGKEPARAAGACRAVVPEMVIDGGADGFNRVDGVAWGPDGRLYVLDGGDHRLIAYDGAGRELWRRGRKGAGPGEFRDASGLVFHAGRLVMRDHGNDRLVFWSVDGEPGETVPLGELPIPGFASWAAPFPAGRVIAVGAPPMGSAASQTLPATLVIVAPGAATVDTVASFPMPGWKIVRTAEGFVPVSMPYAAHTAFEAADDGTIYLARAGAYDVERYDASGRRTGLLRGPAQRPVLSENDRREAVAALPKGVDPSAIEIPREIPPVSGLGSTAEGDLLVWTHWRTDDLRRVDRWSRDGRYVGSMMIPRALQYATLRGDRMAAVQADSLETHTVGLFRIGGATACAGPLPGG